MTQLQESQTHESWCKMPTQGCSTPDPWSHVIQPTGLLHGSENLTAREQWHDILPLQCFQNFWTHGMSRGCKGPILQACRRITKGAQGWSGHERPRLRQHEAQSRQQGLGEAAQDLIWQHGAQAVQGPIQPVDQLCTSHSICTTRRLGTTVKYKYDASACENSQIWFAKSYW